MYEKVQHDIYLLFSCRYRLHKQIYNHHTVKAFEYLLIPILKKIKNTGIEFIHFTDSVIMNNFKNIPELEDVFQRKLPIMIKEQININKLRSDIIFEKINDNKFIIYIMLLTLFSIY